MPAHLEEFSCFCSLHGRRNHVDGAQTRLSRQKQKGGEKKFPLVYDLKLPGCSRLKSTDVLSKNNLTSGSLCLAGALMSG